MSKPRGFTRWRVQPVFAHRRMRLPVFEGIWGWTRTMWNMEGMVAHMGEWEALNRRAAWQGTSGTFSQPPGDRGLLKVLMASTRPGADNAPHGCCTSYRR